MLQDTVGWYADPRERYHGRYFDGARWTADVCDDDLQPLIDPLGIAPSDDADDDALADVHSARRFAVYDQELIRRARSRSGPTSVDGGRRPRPRSLQKLSAAVLVVCCLASLGWWSASAGGELAVVTKVTDVPSQPSNQPDASLSAAAAPQRLAFNDHEGELAMQRSAQPAWSAAAEGCSPPSAPIEVDRPVVGEPGAYFVELCQGILRLTPANGGAGLATELTVGKEAVVLPDGVVVSWRPAGTAQTATATSWDMTFWGGEAGTAATIRVAAVFNEHGVPRPPTPLPGGYVLALPVDVILDGKVTVERPVAHAATADA